MANYLKSNNHVSIDSETISSFFDGFVDAFLFDRVKRYDIRGKAYLTTPSKFYCADVGLRNVRINFRENNIGFMLENVIYDELIVRGFRVDVGFLEKKERKKDGTWTYKQEEVDFIARKGSKEYYIQIVNELPQNETHRNNEYQSLLDVPGSFKKIMVINSIFASYTNEMGILVMPLEEFLLDQESLDR